VYLLSHGFCSISIVIMSRLMLNLHEAAARTAHESHAMRVLENAHTGAGEELELEVVSGDSEPVSAHSGGSNRSGGTLRSLRHPWDECAA
jgi:hypothetical protein